MKVSPDSVNQEIESSVQRFSALTVSPTDAELKLDIGYVNLKDVKAKQECKVVPRVDLIELVIVIGKLVAENKESFKKASEIQVSGKTYLSEGLINVVKGLVQADKLKYIIRPAERIYTLIPLQATLTNIKTTEVLKYNPVSDKKSLSLHKSWVVDSAFMWNLRWKEVNYGNLLNSLTTQLILALELEMTKLAKTSAQEKSVPSANDIADSVFNILVNAISGNAALVYDPLKYTAEKLCDRPDSNKSRENAISAAVAESTYSLVSNLSPLLKTAKVKIFKKAPENPEVEKLLVEAYDSVKKTDFDAAFDKWTQANELSNNQSWQVLANLGTYHYLVGDMEKAVEFYNQSMKIANISPKAKKTIREYRKKAKGNI